MSELLFAQRFVLGFFLTKIGARRGGGTPFRPRLTSAAKERTQAIYQGHDLLTQPRISWFLGGPALSASELTFTGEEEHRA
jgi:hypothetical protein